MTLRFVVLASVAATSLWSQTQPAKLTLMEAQRLAVQNNPQLSAARFNVDAANQVPREIRSGLLPTVTGAVTGVGADSGSRLAAGALNNPVVYNRLGTGLLANQLVTDFGRTGNLAASARLRAQAEGEVAETTRADILIATTRAYFAVLRAESILRVAQQTVSARQLVSDQVTALAQNKLKSALDVSFANVNLSEGRLLLSQARNDREAAEAQLASAMGMPSQTSFDLAEGPDPGPFAETVEALLQQALQDRPDLKELRLQQDAAQRFTRAEHALVYPTVSIAGAAGFVPAGEGAVPGRYGAIGLNLSIPIFNGGLFHARQSEAEFRARAAGENVKDLANRVTRDVRVAYLNAKTAYERMTLTAQLLDQARLALDLAQRRYDLGLSSIVELSQAQLSLTSAEIAQASARYDYQAQRAIVDYQIGALH